MFLWLGLIFSLYSVNSALTCPQNQVNLNGVCGTNDITPITDTPGLTFYGSKLF